MKFNQNCWTSIDIAFLNEIFQNEIKKLYQFVIIRCRRMCTLYEEIQIFNTHFNFSRQVLVAFEEYKNCTYVCDNILKCTE